MHEWKLGTSKGSLRKCCLMICKKSLFSRAVAELEGMLGVWRHFGTSA
jgi:hypothetical protein